jgi:hypothetical protein
MRGHDLLVFAPGDGDSIDRPPRRRVRLCCWYEWTIQGTNGRPFRLDIVVVTPRRWARMIRKGLVCLERWEARKAGPVMLAWRLRF